MSSYIGKIALPIFYLLPQFTLCIHSDKYFEEKWHGFNVMIEFRFLIYSIYWQIGTRKKYEEKMRNNKNYRDNEH